RSDRDWSSDVCSSDLNPEYAAWVLEEVRARGPLAADALPAPDGVARRIPGSWVGTVPRACLEAHFIQGVLAVAERRADFSRSFGVGRAAGRGRVWVRV